MSHPESSGAAAAPEARVMDAVFDHLPVGITVINRDLQVVRVNSRFIEMLELPAAMFASRLPSLEEVTRFNAERGEYGPGDPAVLTHERMLRARQGRSHRFQRLRPNGRVLEITGEPLPDGGFVSIYQDITD